MTEPAPAHEADGRYTPLAGIHAWASAAVDDRAWTRSMSRLDELATGDPDWTEMVRHGVRLAAAHESGALDAMHPGDRSVAMALMRGEASMGDVAPEARPHVAANYEALCLPMSDLGSEPWLRRVHAAACRPQLTHRVHDEHGVDDHVLAAGDYKHHPNHVRTPSGDWQAFAPVALVRTEMGRFAAALGSDHFAALHPAVQAAYAYHGLTHVAPFADGNGRAARAAASAYLLRATSLPLLVFADDGASAEPVVDFVVQRWLGLVHLIDEASGDHLRRADAVARWRARTRAAGTTRHALPAAVEAALDRHARRPDLGWLSRLDGAVVAPTAGSVVIRAAVAPDAEVEEVLEVDAHPLTDDGVPVLRAVHARLGMTLGPDGPGPELDPWLDRVVSCLALRVAAELE